MFQKTGKDLHMSEHTGVGIGLTLCKKVCEELGGLIQLRSKANKGTTFSCFFNISQPSDNLEKSSSNSESGSSSECSSSDSNSEIQ